MTISSLMGWEQVDLCLYFLQQKGLIDIPLSRARLRFNRKSIPLCLCQDKCPPTHPPSPSPSLSRSHLSIFLWRQAENRGYHQTSIITCLRAGNGLLDGWSETAHYDLPLQLYQPISTAAKFNVCRPLVMFWRREALVLVLVMVMVTGGEGGKVVKATGWPGPVLNT